MSLDVAVHHGDDGQQGEKSSVRPYFAALPCAVRDAEAPRRAVRRYDPPLRLAL